jgi:hypothetical protein
MGLCQPAVLNAEIEDDVDHEVAALVAKLGPCKGPAG